MEDPHNQRDSEGTEKATSRGGSLDHSLKVECAPVPPYQAPSENTALTVYLGTYLQLNPVLFSSTVNVIKVETVLP